MPKLTGVLFAGALVLPLAIPIRADDLSRQVVRVAETKTLDAAPSGTVHLQNLRGTVNIEGWDQPRVEITVIKSTIGLYRVSDPKQSDGAKQLLDRLKLQSELRGNEIVIAPQTQRDWRKLNRETLVEYEIKAPRDSKVVIDAGNGGVYVTGMLGDVDATLKQGQLTLVLPENAEYSIDARATFGEVYWDGDGQGQRHHLLGHSFAGRSIPDGPSGATPAPGQTVPIIVTPEGGTPQRIDAPVVQRTQHKLHLNVHYGDIMITKAYTKHTT